ncbi:SDR family NAD(P)-dependent oxidoreductase [Streptomyces sp. NPDC055722]
MSTASRTALITGAASGIGAAVACALSQAGWTVAGLDLHPAADVDLALTADVSDAASTAQAVHQAHKDLGPIHAAITAAGHYESTPLGDITPQAWRRMLRVHLGGLRNTAHAVLPGMLEQSSGSIVAITSELAIAGGDREAHYAAAKGAIIGLVRTLAAEYAPQGIRVNAVAPGPTDTPLLAANSPWRDPQYLQTVPNRRLARPDEIAAAVRLVLDLDFCTGEVISPNCGTVI